MTAPAIALSPSETRRLGIAIALATLVLSAGAGMLLAKWPFVALALLAVVVAGILTLREPNFLLLVVVAVLFSNAAVVAVRFHGMPALVGIGVPLLLLVPLAHQVVVERLPIRFGPAPQLLAAYAVVQLGSALLADDAGAAIGTYMTFLVEGAALYLLVVNLVRSLETIKRVLMVAVLVGAALGGLALFQELTHSYGNTFFGFGQLGGAHVFDAGDWRTWADDLEPRVQQRLAGPIGETNFFAFTLVLLLPFAAWFATRRGKPATRTAGLVAVGLMVAGVGATYSRGAFVAMGLATVVLAFVGVMPRRTFAIVFLGAVVVLAVPTYRERFTGLESLRSVVLEQDGGDSSDAAIEGRYSELVAATRVFVDNPVLGVGPGQFPAYYGAYSGDITAVHRGEERQAHNLFAGVAAESGALGLLTFVGFLVALTAAVARARRRAAGEMRALGTAFLWVITFIVVNGMFLHLAYIRYLWLVLGLAAAYTVVASDETASSRSDPAHAASS